VPDLPGFDGRSVQLGGYQNSGNHYLNIWTRTTSKSGSEKSMMMHHRNFKYADSVLDPVKPSTRTSSKNVPGKMELPDYQASIA
jgi:hypothetical protein